jgi:hypothetical protein
MIAAPETETPRHMEVAAEIQRQILASGIAYSGSWGMHQLLGCASPEHRGARRFFVDGRRFTGKVEVALLPSDTYRLRLYRRTSDVIEPYVLDDKLEGVYAEDLVEILDRRIESGGADAVAWTALARGTGNQ